VFEEQSADVWQVPESDHLAYDVRPQAVDVEHNDRAVLG
jgi:hypothetical protein